MPAATGTGIWLVQCTGIGLLAVKIARFCCSTATPGQKFQCKDFPCRFCTLTLSRSSPDLSPLSLAGSHLSATDLISLPISQPYPRALKQDEWQVDMGGGSLALFAVASPQSPWSLCLHYPQLEIYGHSSIII